MHSACGLSVVGKVPLRLSQQRMDGRVSEVPVCCSITLQIPSRCAFAAVKSRNVVFGDILLRMNLPTFFLYASTLIIASLE